MDLESKALSAGRGDAHNQKKSASNKKAACGSNGDVSQDDSSVQSNEEKVGKRKRGADIRTSDTKKRNRLDEENSVAIYNLPSETNCETVEKFVERMFKEMHHRKRIKIQAVKKVRCRHTRPARYTYLVNFATAELADLAMSLNGVQFLEQTLHVSICHPDWSLDRTEKLRLCFDHFIGACPRGIDDCCHAHGVLDLKLYHETVLSEKRTIYIDHVPFNYPPGHLLNTVKKRFNNHDIFPFFTAFHVRGGKGDALLEFADIRHAKRAHEILDGTISISKSTLEVHPWKPEYQSVFVEYFKKNDSRTGTGEKRKNLSAPATPKSTKISKILPRKHEGAAAQVTPATQARALPRTTDDKETKSASAWEDDKRELRRLRDEVYKFKWQQKRLAELEEQNVDCKRLLNEADHDVRYYRDKFERERSYAKDFSRMEDELDDLRRENDHLMRENDNLRTRQRDSRSVGKYGDIDNRLQDELRHTRLKYEESRDRIYDLKCELDKTMEEKEVLVRDSKRLKSSMKRLEASRNSVKTENESVSQRQDELQRRLDEARSTIEALNGALATTQLQLKGMESERGTMNETIVELQVENETLQEEMEQMRMNHAMELGFKGVSDGS